MTRARFLNGSSLLLVGTAAAWAMAMPQACAFDIGGRWSATQLDGGGLQRGDPVTLRWSVVPDGQSYERSSADKTSNLIQFLDDGWNISSAQRTPDFTNRAWWNVINNAYAQYSRVSGVTLTYVPEQDASGVSTGLRGDIRIGGEDFNGDPGGALADNVYPDGGDMRIDTARENNGSIGFYFSTEPGLRNLVIHETGHGVGLGHSNPVNNSAKAVMEGGLRTDIWGLQFDDVYALNRQYGDPMEKNGGNNIYSTATDLGVLGSTGRFSWGLDASDTVVNQLDDDWLGIDGRNDADWFKFTITDSTFATVRLLPIGPTYETTEQGVFNALAQNDLVMQLFTIDPNLALVANLDEGTVGGAERIDLQYFSPGDYYVRVYGKQDLNQFYRLDFMLDDSQPIADFDLDGDVDADDLTFWQAGYGLTAGASQNNGDADKDGDVDGHDFLIWQRQLGLGMSPMLAVHAVPEAQTLLLVASACLIMVPGRGLRS